MSKELLRMLSGMVEGAPAGRRFTVAEIQGAVAKHWKKPNPFKAGDVVVLAEGIPNIKWKIGMVVVVVSVDPDDIVHGKTEAGQALTWDAYSDMVVARPAERVGYHLDNAPSSFFRLATPEEIALHDVEAQNSEEN